ncbi:hypothetical protein [Amycolatopsis viridis]|uniref:Uncharacterized protein n=1 Tax=Amycolatopsis viridis TaxID=185678 RepID=A0ABX0SZP2_9PSEU|nr:hypothetical protein [Amycolatopsis viridis]NIH81397.1 hypothetical protein [Amycolatopsis viridis]
MNRDRRSHTEQDLDSSRTSIAEDTGDPIDDPQPGRAAVSRSTDEAPPTGTTGQADYPRDTENG